MRPPNRGIMNLPLNFASLSHHILVRLQVILTLWQFTFSSNCMRYHTILRICALNTRYVSYIDSYSKIDLYTCEVTWTSVVCYLLAFDIFNYYHSVNVVNFTLGSSKEFECYDPELIKQKQSRNHSVNRYPVYIVIFDSLYLHLCFGLLVFLFYDLMKNLRSGI